MLAENLRSGGQVGMMMMMTGDEGRKPQPLASARRSRRLQGSQYSDEDDDDDNGDDGDDSDGDGIVEGNGDVYRRVPFFAVQLVVFS
jgi:hypothetical protein